MAGDVRIGQHNVNLGTLRLDFGTKLVVGFTFLVRVERNVFDADVPSPTFLFVVVLLAMES